MVLIMLWYIDTIKYYGTCNTIVLTYNTMAFIMLRYLQNTPYPSSSTYNTVLIVQVKGGVEIGRYTYLGRHIATIELKGVRTKASRSLRDSHRKYLT
jgi:hypothetical protein